MHRAGRTLVALVLAGGPVLASAAPAYACSCVGRGPLEREVAAAEVAFKGEVVAHVGNGMFRVRVAEVYRGSVAETVEVAAESDRRSSCGVTLPLGPIVYVGERELRVNLCSATLYGDAARDADTSGLAPKRTPAISPTAADRPGAPPGGEDGAGLLPVVAAWGLGGASVLAVGAALWARRVRPAPPPR